MHSWTSTTLKCYLIVHVFVAVMQEQKHEKIYQKFSIWGLFPSCGYSIFTNTCLKSFCFVFGEK